MRSGTKKALNVYLLNVIKFLQKQKETSQTPVWYLIPEDANQAKPPSIIKKGGSGFGVTAESGQVVRVWVGEGR